MGDGVATETIQRLSTEGADLLTLAGPGDANLAELQKLYPVRVTLRGDAMAIAGAAEAVDRAAGVAARMIEQARQAQPLEPDDVLRFSLEGPARETGTPGRIVLPGVRKVIQPKTQGQAEYLEKLMEHEIVIGIGPAGTGKTYLAVAAAVDALARKRVRRIVLARPAVEAGESLGFLPGDMQAKVDPYLRPLYDALDDLMPPERVARALETRVIEIAPLAYMRGRTLADAFVILDEAQNTTPAQMRMVLTRLGEGSRMVVTGDPTQIDLPPNQLSGLIEAAQVLEGVEGVAICQLTAADVVRHPLVQRLVNAYASRDAARQTNRPR